MATLFRLPRIIDDVDAPQPVLKHHRLLIVRPFVDAFRVPSGLIHVQFRRHSLLAQEEEEMRRACSLVAISPGRTVRSTSVRGSSTGPNSWCRSLRMRMRMWSDIQELIFRFAGRRINQLTVAFLKPSRSPELLYIFYLGHELAIFFRA